LPFAAARYTVPEISLLGFDRRPEMKAADTKAAWRQIMDFYPGSSSARFVRAILSLVIHSRQESQ
jgi:hypothetical protein